MALARCSAFPVSRLNTTSIACISSTSWLRHNPGLKKKQKQAINSQKQAQLRDRQLRKKKQAPILPPHDPDSVPDPAWLEPSRLRPVVELSADEQEERVLLLKEWSRRTMSSHKQELQRMQERIKCRQEVLRELKKISQELYEDALEVDKDMFPLTFHGPVETLPVDGYEAPDVDEQRSAR